MDSKQSIIDLVSSCFEKGIRKVVCSPGSRNAPMIIAFDEHGGFETFSIPDERVAGFFALGMAQQLKETVAIVCTSGSAVLNFSPAIAEAYYQRIPLLVLTADRPPEWIDQGNGQTMRQRNIYTNFIKKSFEINHETVHEDELWYNVRIYNEAINETNIEPKGPVHINIPLREPLYDFDFSQLRDNPIKLIDQLSPPPSLSPAVLDNLAATWNESKKKLILCGITPKSKELNDLLFELAKDPSVIVLTETTSNLFHSMFIEQLDRILFTINEDDFNKFKPDLLLTFGTNIVSKKIKTLFRKWEIREHWHLDETDVVIDTFKSLTKHLRSDLVCFFTGLLYRQKPNDSVFSQTWKTRDIQVRKKHFDFLKKAPWSDILAYQILLENLPEGCNLQMANSTAIRYVQLMEKRKDILYHSNRGVAGIDGCSSTAVGAAWINNKKTVLVTGDIAFIYDSNALWMPYLSSGLRIVIFNNEGGSIFRFIPGPDRTRQLEKFFESHHTISAEHIASAFSIPYFKVSGEQELKQIIPEFWRGRDSSRPAILEIFTPRFENDKILKTYFKHLLSK